MNILIVEDRPSVAQAIAQCFNGIDQISDVHISLNYDNAIKCLTHKHYDVFLLDINLDKSRNGIELCKYIRTQNTDCLIIFISGFINDNMLNELYEAGANDFIRKPFVRREIRLRVLNWWNFIKAGKTKKKCLKYFDMKYDLTRNTLFVGVQKIPLTKALRRLIILFLQHPASIISYRKIQTVIWGDHDTSLIQRNIKERIFELRKRLPKPYKDWIISEPGEGYILQKPQ